MQLQTLLTLKQQRVLDTVREYIAARGSSPTLEELRGTLGVSSLRTVTQYLEILERKGHILRRKNSARNIELRSGSGWGTVSIPVVANVGCDDLSVFAQPGSCDEFLEVDKRIVDEEEGSIVAVRAIGDSMNDAGINTGDYVLIRFTEDVKDGDRVAVIVNDMVTVKRLERRGGMTILWPESKDPRFKPIILKEDFKIAGKVLCIIPGAYAESSEIVPSEE